MTTMRVSWYLSYLEAKLLMVAYHGDSVGPETLRQVADLLRVCSVDANRMELQIAGVEAYPANGNVISLRPYLLKKRHVIRRVVDQDQPL